MGIIGRLAPSPTGAQHLGNARTYLLAYWAARSCGKDARLVMRIEDIDSPRVKPWASQQAIDDLRWLGVDWEAGPDIGGPQAPYVQTLRMEHYAGALQKLIADNRVFPCTCSRRDIAAAASAPHENPLGTVAFEHEGPIYPGTCAAWQAGNAVPESGTYCWRFRPSDDVIRFNDRVAGEQGCNPARQLGAFPVTQKNGTPSYQLAVVVDDQLMGINQVVRGNDLIASTFRQIDLHRALGYPELTAPNYAHVPLVVGSDQRRLAKRHGDTRLSWYRDQGIAAEQIVGWAAHSAGFVETNAPIAASDVSERFDWDRFVNDQVVVDQFPPA